MPLRDSLDKVIGGYIGAVCAAPFTYAGKVYQPKRLRVSPLLFRGFTCPEGCGGCCPRFSLDYLPNEKRPQGLQPREVLVSGVLYTIYSDLQLDHQNHHCKHLDKSNGRCKIHEYNPFSCDFELIRFMQTKDEDRPNYLTQRLFGRGWAMLRVDGERGAKCEMLPISNESVAEVVRKLSRLKEWCTYFSVRHKVDAILEWARYGARQEPLFI